MKLCELDKYPRMPTVTARLVAGVTERLRGTKISHLGNYLRLDEYMCKPIWEFPGRSSFKAEGSQEFSVVPRLAR